ncbi:MAG: hypothetical protein MUO73_08410 [Thermoplasmata archaeon]|nr:hypothetical protein [Thermoplasmata archaeon]MBE3139357.1 hypothetical protein [Thermoplasmata archaeon]MCJ7698332.1 hypothetical protein [Thermoplasmata archaeon]
MYGFIVIFRLPKKTNNTTLSKFCQKFYGQNTSSHNGKYRYHRYGILDNVPHCKIIRGVLIIRTQDLKKVTDFLQEYGAETHIRVVKLNEEDVKILKVPIK